jgi:UDP-3-O-[3-hydroxymyristoyl] glucosamine N-acyltransferase
MQTCSEKYSVMQITDLLNELQIHYELVGDVRSDLSFSSIKNPVHKGIYFIEEEYFENGKCLKDSLIITNAQVKNTKSNAYILVDNPQLVFYLICRRLFKKKTKGEIHPTAILNKKACIAKNVYIGPYCVIGSCEIQEKSMLYGHITISDKVKIGKNVEVDFYSHIGSAGLAWVWGDKGERIIQPQIGGVIIDENCFIGSGVGIARGSVNENTIIERETAIAQGSKIGHGTVIKEKCHLGNNVTLAGNCTIGESSFIGSGSVISSQVFIGANNVIGAGAVVTKSFYETGYVLAGVPAKVIKKVEKKLRGVPRS